MSSKVSSGCAKDLMVIQFAHSLIHVSKQENAVEENGLITRTDNKVHKINKKIDILLESMADKLKYTINEIFEDGGIETAAWVRKNLDKRIGGTLTQIQEKTINLEMLAMYVLFVNFAEKARPLHPAYQWLDDADQYFKITDLMTKTKIEELENAMFMTAYDVVNKIKG